jgi:hypothetical protein
MAQNIISLGIDVSGFNSKKMATLEQFIELFDKLQKYDGMKVSPIAGDGLAAFNQSVTATNKLLEELNTKITTLNDLSQSNKTIVGQSAAILNKHKDDMKAMTIVISQQEKEIVALKNKLSDLAKQMVSNSNQTKNSNSTKKEESEKIKTLLIDYNKLKLSLQEQEALYKRVALAHGTKSPQAQIALKEYKATEAVLANINGKMKESTDGAAGLGRALGSGLNFLRQWAYILPGIGLAGMFGLAYDAIGKVIMAIIKSGEEIADVSERQEKLNNAIREELELVKSIREQREALNSITDGASSYNMQNNADVRSAAGYNKAILLQDKIDVAEKAKEEAKAVMPGALSPDKIVSNINAMLKKEQSLSQALKKLESVSIKKDEQTADEKIDLVTSIIVNLSLLQVTNRQSFKDAYQKLKNKKVNGSYLNGTQEDIDALLSETKSEIELNKYKVSENINILKNYLDKDKELRVANAEYTKFMEDENRKKNLEFAKADANLKISISEDLFNKEISTEKRKSAELEKQRQAKLAIIQSEFDFVNKNLSSTPADKEIADKKKTSDTGTLNNLYDSKQEKLAYEYYQKRLTANLTINKNEIEVEARTAEKIYQNENNNFNSRLAALAAYISKKQTMQNLEMVRDLDRQFLQTGDKTSKAQIDAIRSETTLQLEAIQSDSKKKAYDITYSSLGKELGLIKEINQLEDNITLQQYTKELKDLNTSYENKLTSYEDYKEKKKLIDYKYSKITLDEAIQDDKDDLARLRNQKSAIEQELKKSDEALPGLYDNMKSLGEQASTDKSKVPAFMKARKDYDIELGKNRGLSDSLVKISESEDVAQDKLVKDMNKREGIEPLGDKLKKNNRFDFWIDVEKALYEAIKEIRDAQLKEQLERIELEKNARMEMYDLELSAISKSSLSAKDKIALEVQLNAQKVQAEKEYALEVRRIKYEDAIFNRQLEIAHIIASTSLAVMKAAPDKNLMNQTMVIGAINLAKISSIPIPSYSKGTKSHEGGLARYGEDGIEIVKEPNKKPYLVLDETISYLPKGTEIIPIKDSPVFEENVKSDGIGWEQVRFLAKQIKKQSVTNKFNPTIKIDLGFENYKRKILGN